METCTVRDLRDRIGEFMQGSEVGHMASMGHRFR